MTTQKSQKKGTPKDYRESFSAGCGISHPRYRELMAVVQHIRETASSETFSELAEKLAGVPELSPIERAYVGYQLGNIPPFMPISEYDEGFAVTVEEVDHPFDHGESSYFVAVGMDDEKGEEIDAAVHGMFDAAGKKSDFVIALAGEYDDPIMGAITSVWAGACTRPKLPFPF